VAAQEQQHHRVVRAVHVGVTDDVGPVDPVEGGRVGRVDGGLLLAAAAGAVAAPLVDQGSGRDGVQPRAGPVRDSLGRPLRGGGGQGLLDGVLAGVELPVPAGQLAEDLRREVAQQVLERGR
jgi:hypothetical protein